MFYAKCLDGLKLFLLFISLCIATAAEIQHDSIDGFELGTKREKVLERGLVEGLTYSRGSREKDKLEILSASDGSRLFFLNDGIVVGITGNTASYKGKVLSKGLTQEEIVSLLGKPEKIKMSKPHDDILSARQYHFKNEHTTMIIHFGTTPKAVQEWHATAFYLFENRWL